MNHRLDISILDRAAQNLGDYGLAIAAINLSDHEAGHIDLLQPEWTHERQQIEAILKRAIQPAPERKSDG